MRKNSLVWLFVLVVLTSPEGSPVGVMTEQIEAVSRAVRDDPVGSLTELHMVSGHIRTVREPLGKVLDILHDVSERK